MGLKTEKSNFKKELIKYIKTVKLKYLIFAIVVMFLSLSADATKAIGETIKYESFKKGFLKYIDSINIVKIIIPNIYIRSIIFIILIMLLVVIWYIRNIYVEPTPIQKAILHVLSHSTMGKTQFKLDDKLLETVQPDIKELNLIEDVKAVKDNYDQLSFIVNIQDSLIEKFKAEINNIDKYGYMGISHTPLILRAGYKIGNETKFILFHMKRDFDFFEQLSDNELYTPIKVEKKIIKNNSKELIVAISTTFQIQDDELSILHIGNKSLIKFRSDVLGYDVIMSKKQVNDYLNIILSEVRQVVKDKGITKIHMAISSSAAFTFALGQALSSHHDPEIIIYHFEMKNPKKYPCGISLSHSNSECIVIN